MQIDGFDYRTQKKARKSMKDWRAEGAQVRADGGFRRVEHAETFFHGADGKLLFEVYGNVPASGNLTEGRIEWRGGAE